MPSEESKVPAPLIFPAKFAGVVRAKLEVLARDMAAGKWDTFPPFMLEPDTGGTVSVTLTPIACQHEDTVRRSSCCNAKPLGDFDESDICSTCKDHAGFDRECVYCGEIVGTAEVSS